MFVLTVIVIKKSYEWKLTQNHDTIRLAVIVIPIAEKAKEHCMLVTGIAGLITNLLTVTKSAMID